MAADWIMMRMNLADDPAVIGIAHTLKLDEDLVVGKLHRFWSWFNAQSRDGHAPSVTEAWLDRKLGVKGFTAALVSVGWLIVDPTGITLPNFDRWNGSTAKSRGLATRRKQMSRSDRDNCHAVSVTETGPEQSRAEKSIKKPAEEDSVLTHSHSGLAAGCEARDALVKAGVGEPALSLLARVSEITPAIIEAERASINGATNPAGVLVSRLCSRFGIKLPKGKAGNLDGSISQTAAKLIAARDNRRTRHAT